MATGNPYQPLTPDFRTHVHEALQQWHADPSAGSSIGYLNLVTFERISGATNIRDAANRVLNHGLEKLAETNHIGASVLRFHFCDDKPTHVVANRLNVADATIYRYQANAISQLAEVLAVMEGEVRGHRQTLLEARLEPSTYLHLFGVDEQRDQLLDLLLADDYPWIVALNGMGGIGKTSLADATMRELIRRRLDGEVAWISARQQRFDLAGTVRNLDQPALTVSALLEALTVQLLPSMPPVTSNEKTISALRSVFDRHPTLVVVDNLETVADVESLMPVLRKLAKPAKFLLTSRQSLFGEADVYHTKVSELNEHDALSLVRQEAGLRNLPELAVAGDAELRPIYQTVGGNPLALRLVVGQSHIHSLAAILSDLQGARGTPVEMLYNFIYRWAWDNLSETPRQALLAMPLVVERGGNLEFLMQLSGLEPGALSDALAELVTLNLVDSRGGPLDRRYSIHNLTRTFLLEQVIRWK
ncbi:MAG: NB-ARC domain-containing protein [Caldilineales bacterium]